MSTAGTEGEVAVLGKVSLGDEVGCPRPVVGWGRLRCALHRGALVLCLLLTACTVTACGGGAAAPAHDPLLDLPVPTQVQLDTRPVAGLGVVLTDGTGTTLYMFPPDASRRVACTGPCAGTWPPLVIATGAKPSAGPGVDAADLATLPDPNTGARIVTYGGHPLYRYAGDLATGTANGQRLILNGGPWYVLGPDGRPITATPDTGS